MTCFKKLCYVFFKMIAGHDRQKGISWDTVEHYLREFCKNNS